MLLISCYAGFLKVQVIVLLFFIVLGLFQIFSIYGWLNTEMGYRGPTVHKRPIINFDRTNGRAFKLFFSTYTLNLQVTYAFIEWSDGSRMNITTTLSAKHIILHYFLQTFSVISSFIQFI